VKIVEFAKNKQGEFRLGDEHTLKAGMEGVRIITGSRVIEVRRPRRTTRIEIDLNKHPEIKGPVKTKRGIRLIIDG